MILHKIKTTIKKLNQLRGKLKFLKSKLKGKEIKLRKSQAAKYLIDSFDLEKRIQHLERIQRSFGLKSEAILDFEGRTCYRYESSSRPKTFHTVRLWEKEFKDRCDCEDAHHRNRKCVHQMHAERKELRAKLLEELSLFRKVKKKPEVNFELRVEEVDIANFMVYEGEQVYNVNPHNSRISDRCSCDKTSLFGGKCEHQKAVEEFLNQERKQQQEKQAADNLARTEQKEKEWLIYVDLIKPCVVEAIEKAGIKVILAENIGYLSIRTDKGLIQRDFQGWSVTFPNGKRKATDSETQSIEYLKNPLSQFIDIELKVEAMEIFYQTSRVQILKFYQGSSVHRSLQAHFYIYDSATKRVVDFVEHSCAQCWEIAVEKKEYYEAFMLEQKRRIPSYWERHNKQPKKSKLMH